MSKIITGIAAVLSAAALGLGAAGPAYADSIGVRDPRDVDHGVDLRAVQLDHRARNVIVITSHTDLRRTYRTGSAGTVYVDTDRADRGPEFVFLAGLFDGTDYTLFHTEGFGRRNWGVLARGSYEMDLDYAAERVRIRFSRATLGRPDEVRVAVRVSGESPDGTDVVDWLREPRSFTRSVERG